MKVGNKGVRLVPCHSCGGDVAAGQDENDHYFIAHKLPVCREYIELDGEGAYGDFLRACRLKIGITDEMVAEILGERLPS